MMTIMMMIDCRGVNLSLRLLQDVFHVDRGIDW